eukprot:259780_1
MASAIDLLDSAIADLEAKLNLAPGQSVPTPTTASKASKQQDTPVTAPAAADAKPKQAKKKKEKKPNQKPAKKKAAAANHDQPDICKLEFKVGQITKVWVHPDADKLYCEEIECGEGTPRQIASGLRPHYSLEEMMGRRLLVVSNLKTKKLAGFPSSGMVLCAAEAKEDGSGEKVEFVEPPEGAEIGE